MIQKNAIQLDVKIGTSGYSYEDWKPYFYPEALSKNAMLTFYSQFFQAVEINSSYYHIPSAHIMRRISEKVPAGFEFIVKTNQETTHRRKENEAALKQIVEAVRPLIENGQFKGFLAQFPYSFKNYEQNRRYLVATRKCLGDLPLFVEFRHASWVNEHLREFLSDNGIGYVNVDEPRLTGLLPPQDWVTSGEAYVRFHGRNEKDWWDGKGSQRYDYEYSDEQLREWLRNLKSIFRKASKTYIFFNNHPRGQAIKNARQMMDILQQQLHLQLAVP